MRCLLLVLAWLAIVAQCQEDITKTVVERAINDAPTDDENAPVSDEKFKIYVGTIDGVRRELFNEVDGGQVEVTPDNTPNPSDPFGAYDDNNIITTENEKVLFVPKPYRPGGDKKETKKPKTTTTTTTTAVPTTIRTIPFVQTTPASIATIAPITRGPIQQQTFKQSFQQRPQTLAPAFNRPPPPTAPPRVIPPQQPIQPFQPRPSFTRRPPQPQPQPTAAPTRPVVQQTSTPAPRPPFPQNGNLRTGQCAASIFYISTPINGPSRLTFTHFAVAVTVDQCARTCHEFNCAIAHYNPLNGHCEFNPSTAFAIRNGQCPAWPSLHYRNNVVANEPVRIFCVTCQRPRRRPAGARRPFRGRQRNGQRLGRQSKKVRQQRETSSETAQVEVAPKVSQNQSPSQLDLLKQLEDLQL